MSTPSPLGTYRPGRGPLHRLRPGAKLLGLFGFAIAVVWSSGVPATAISLGIAVALAVAAGLRGRDLWRVVRGFALIAIPLLLFTAASAAFAADAAGTADAAGSVASQPVFPWSGAGSWPDAEAWARGWARGFEVVGDLFSLVLAASAVTASTAVEDMLGTIAWTLGPLRRFGAEPERAALAFSLVIRAIPSILGIARETQEAARARGLERDPRARVVPLVLRTVAHAQLTGEALAARGIGEE